MKIDTVLFVHGTGVRKASFERNAALVAQGLVGTHAAVQLRPCLWGDALGARLHLGGASIPEFSALQQPTVSDDQVMALWELLGRDPLFELRELAVGGSAVLQPPAELALKKSFVGNLQGLAQHAPALALLASHALAVQWQQAVQAVVDDDAFKLAVAASKKVDTALRVASARAAVAALQQQLADDQMPALRQPVRDALVDRCVDALGGRELGVKDWITSRLVGLGLRWATAKARRERDALFSAAHPVAGDILLYQARGQGIRDFIAQQVLACQGGVAIVAHSLGGVACVDLLVSQPLPLVQLLVTVGSQAPFLYEIGALWSLPSGQPLPAHFPRHWHNFYDPDDLLSYCAAPVFPGRAVDHCVHSGQPFPHAHSAYWDQPALWSAIGQALRAERS